MRAALLAAALGTLGACTTVHTVTVPERVEVPIPVACLKPADVPAKPATPTQAELLAMDRYRRTLALWAAYARLQGYSDELEALVDGCARLSAATNEPR